ncbi:hypothetical protein PIB30_046130 [Stylosanthes scabra]|uniref:TF-B3 domain-containing protein n=1 Tax=Stylosanthes scabra TaxID=79078 RepID=A0ABU6RGD5_9FABA|nr:hypothetical protein [Stylosanthes scabra]
MSTHSPSFFKILIHKNKFKEVLMIPKGFVRRYWNRISSNPIVLKLPNNVEEKVHWIQEKEKDEVWLEKGWERVVKLCNLQYGFLVTFDLKEKSTFEIKVYDQSALQLHYHSHFGVHNDDDQREPNTKTTDITQVAQILYGSTQRAHHINYRIHMRSGLYLYRFCTDLSPKLEEPSRVYKEEISSPPGSSKSMAKVRRNNMKYDGGRNALERAEAMCSNLKNPSFVLDMKPSYIYGNVVFIPSLFSRKYLDGLNGSGTIWVSEDEEKKWDIHCSFYNEGKRRKTAITGGWRKFRVDNELQVGTRKRDMSEVRRNNNIQNAQRKKALEKAKAISSKLENPFFFRDMHPSYIKNNLVIPNLFSREHLNELNGSGTIWVSDEDEEKKWPIKYNFDDSRRRSYINGGWNVFCKKYELKVESEESPNRQINNQFEIRVTKQRLRSSTFVVRATS